MQKIINHWRYFCNSVKILSKFLKSSAGLCEINERCHSSGSPLTAPHRHCTTRLANQETVAAAWMSTGGGGNEFTQIAIYLKKIHRCFWNGTKLCTHWCLSANTYNIYVYIYIYMRYQFIQASSNYMCLTTTLHFLLSGTG